MPFFCEIFSVFFTRSWGKIEILKRLIVSSNTLNLDDKSYADELEESGISKASINALRKAVIQDIKVRSIAQNTEKTTFEFAKTAFLKALILALLIPLSSNSSA